MRNARVVIMAMVVGALTWSVVARAEEPAAAPEGAWKAHFEQRRQAWEAFRQKQRQADEQFRATLKGMAKDQRIAALEQHRQQDHQQAMDFWAQQHEASMAFLKERLAQNTKLDDAEKTELIAFFEQQYKENVDFRNGQFAESFAFVEKTLADASLTKEQKKAAIHTFLTQQHKEDVTHREQQKGERRQEVQKVRGK